MGFSRLCWESLGVIFGKIFNLKFWYDFVMEYIWIYLRPVAESIQELATPVYNLAVSWTYFFIGFERTEYIALSYTGIILTATGGLYFYVTNSEHMSQIIKDIDLPPKIGFPIGISVISLLILIQIFLATFVQEEATKRISIKTNKAELRKMLDEKGIPYTDKMTKRELEYRLIHREELL